MSEFVLKAEQLTKIFGKKHAVDNLSFEIEENSITGLIGRNGSGKTTLMKMIAGQMKQTSGSVFVFGEAPMDNLDVQKQIIYSYHNFYYNRSLNLKLILQDYHDLFPNFDMQFALKLMCYFDLNGKMKYHTLSQGMNSIFNFLCALSCRTRFTMFDEPVLGMDATVRKEAYEILLRDYVENPRTFLISSHLLNELEPVLSDLLLIEKGSKVLHAGIDEARDSAYRIDGEANRIEHFIQGKTVLEKQDGPLQSFAIVFEPFTAKTEQDVRKCELTVSSISAEELCIYMTKQDKKEELKCLWEEK